jgi:hypothetical protein
MRDWYYHKCGSRIAKVEPGGCKVHVYCSYCKKEVEVTYEGRNEGLNKFIELQEKKLQKLKIAK